MYTNMNMNRKEFSRLFSTPENELNVELFTTSDWYEISSRDDLSEDFILKHKDKLIWSSISCRLDLSEDFLLKCKDKIEWWRTLQVRTFSEDFIDHILSEAFIERYVDKLCMDYVLERNKVSEDLLKKAIPYLRDFGAIIRTQKVSEAFLREFVDKLNWLEVSRYQTLSEEFIREFKNKVVWFHISRYQTLSEDFIREFKNKVKWRAISQFQNMSSDFIKEFKNKLDMEVILQENNNIRLSVDTIIQNLSLIEDFNRFDYLTPKEMKLILNVKNIL